MIQLILFRILPVVAALGIIGGALSPVNGTLKAFGAAAEALAGNTHVDSEPIVITTSTAALGKVQGLGKAPPSPKKRSLLALSAKVSGEDAFTGDDEKDFGWNAGDRAAKKLPPTKR